MSRAVELGATVAIPADDMPGVGRFVNPLNPDVNMFGPISPVMSDGTTAMGPDATE